MQEEKSLFVQRELNRWKRPESPKPGTAFIFVGDGKPSLTIYEGDQGPTQGELLFGKYNTYYEVDMGDRSLNFHERLPCADAFEFHAEIKLTYAVSDPALVVRHARTDAGLFLKDLAVYAMRHASRSYTHEQMGDAEDAVAGRIEVEVRDNGFKLSRPAFVKLSLDEAVRTRLINRQLGDYAFQDQKTQISRKTEIDELQQTAKLGLKGKRVEIFAPLIKAGDWATLLAMLDPNDPEDAPIQAMIETILNQERMKGESYQKMLEIAIEKGAIEGWQLEGMAKALFQEVSGLPEQSVAFLEGKQKLEGSQQTQDVKPSVPDEISRDKDD
jgi:hypothetical protein